MILEWERYLHSPKERQPWWYRAVSSLLASAYSAILMWREKASRLSRRAPVSLPGLTISVGNLSVGGTGKTPVLIEIARRLREHNVSVAVLTRGYGVAIPANGAMFLLAGKSQLSLHCDGLPLPDEALLVSSTLPDVPVIAGPRRAHAAQWFLQNAAPSLHPTVWILDDGFQHRQIGRDLDIVLLDAATPFGNGSLLPAGPLREPCVALNRADLVLFTRASQGFPDRRAQDDLRKFTAVPFFAVSFDTLSPRQVTGSPLAPSWVGEWVVATGIAQPERFARAVEGLGLKVTTRIFRPDHAAIRQEDLRSLSQDAAIMTTEKDFYRNPQFWNSLGHSVYVCPLRTSLPQDAWSFIKTWLGLPN